MYSQLIDALFDEIKSEIEKLKKWKESDHGIIAINMPTVYAKKGAYDAYVDVLDKIVKLKERTKQ